MKAVQVVKKARIFISRLDPDETVDNMKEYVKGLTGEDCDVEKLNARFPTYSSFVITCSKRHENTLLDPDEWEEGLLVRPFYGKIMKNNTVDKNDVWSNGSNATNDETQ